MNLIESPNILPQDDYTNQHIVLEKLNIYYINIYIF